MLVTMRSSYNGFAGVVVLWLLFMGPSLFWARKTTGFHITTIQPKRIPLRERYGCRNLQHQSVGSSSSTIQCWTKPKKQEEEEEEEDWRAFRAKLVLQERQQEEGTSTTTKPEPRQQQSQSEDTTTDSSIEDIDTWAYESGPDVIEQGSVILNRPPTKPYKDFGFGLGKQYLHKSVILVLEHDPVKTTGIILNRPTDLVLSDDDDEEQEPQHFPCQIWYGGPEYGIHTHQPKFYCLHNLKTDMAMEISKDIIQGIQFTSLGNAQTLVQEGEASSTDFWVFCGFEEFETEELVDECKRGLWHSVATDAKTLRNGLRILTAGAGVDTRDAGLSTWSILMKMIGRWGIQEEENSEANTHEFDDLMLREWATQYLVFDGKTPLFLQDGEEEDTQEEFLDTDIVRAGDIVRGSSASRSPFLLENQEFHKSLVLIIQDDEKLSVGVLLNQPSARTVDLQLASEDSFFDQQFTISIPLRYGGPIDIVEDETPLFFLHQSPSLRTAEIGEPISDDCDDSIWRCTMDEAAEAIAKHIAAPQDFLVVRGFCVWEKYEDGSGGMWQEIQNGNFELVSPIQTPEAWDLLIAQETLSSTTLQRNMELSNFAWTLAGERKVVDETKQDGRRNLFVFGDGLGDEKGGSPPRVFKSDVKVSTLSDDAVKVWAAAFLLDDATFRP